MSDADQRVLDAGMSPNTFALFVDKLETAAQLVSHTWSDIGHHDVAAALADLVRLIDTAESARRTAVELLRQSGASWTQIGDLLGITKQAAQQRFGDERRI